MQEKGLNKFRIIVFEVSAIVGNPVTYICREALNPTKRQSSIIYHIHPFSKLLVLWHLIKIGLPSRMPL